MRHRHRSTPRHLAILGLAAGLGVSLGCGSDTTGPSETVQNNYWTLQLNARAITLSVAAPGNQLQLRSTKYVSGITNRGDFLLKSELDALYLTIFF